MFVFLLWRAFLFHHPRAVVCERLFFVIRAQILNLHGKLLHVSIILSNFFPEAMFACMCFPRGGICAPKSARAEHSATSQNTGAYVWALAFVCLLENKFMICDAGKLPRVWLIIARKIADRPSLYPKSAA